MPQPPISLQKYLASPLPTLREQYPPGTGGTGPRAEWPEGTLKDVQVIDDFKNLTKSYLTTLPQDPVRPHPGHRYPKFVQVAGTLPNPLKSPADLQKCLSILPLGAISSVLTALIAHPADLQSVSRLDQAGYESDGGEEANVHLPDSGKTQAYHWRFNKSPMGSGEFYLMREGSDDVSLVVRTINSSAFTPHDWEEYIVSGAYRYDTKSKASWYWSRTWGACKRLECRYWVLTDWQRWAFGCFDEKKEHGWCSPLMYFNDTEPSILESLLFWARCATGQAEVNLKSKDLSTQPPLFPANPSRRISQSTQQRVKVKDDRKVKSANESDIEESDAEAVE